MMKNVKSIRNRGREAILPEEYPLWCRIEDLSALCGYNPAAQFPLLMELPDAYPASGRAPEELAEEHPMQALAAYIRRFLRDYPEAAAGLAAAGAVSPEAPEAA